jgi:hypothetical protein
MRIRPDRPVRVPVWIAGIALCLLNALGTLPTVRSIPVSYASIPDERGASMDEAEPGGSWDARADRSPADLAVTPRPPTHRRYRARCPECGVVESMREIGRSGDRGGQAAIDLDGTGRTCGSAIDADAAAEQCFEITVRFRDGSRTIFREASPRTWRAGNRVMVIGRADPSSD